MSSSAITQRQWAEQVLQGLGAPLTNNNIGTLITWQNAENGPADNPLNTTLGQAGTQGSSIKGYGSVPAGVAATVATLKEPAYSGIVSGLKKNAGFALIGEAIINSPWDLHHYASTNFLSEVDNAISTFHASPPIVGGTAGKVLQIVGAAGLAGFAAADAGLLGGGAAGGGGAAAGAEGTAAGSGASTVAKLLAAGTAGAAGVAAYEFVKSHWLRIFEFLGGVIMVVYGVFLLGKVGMETG